MPPPRPRGFGNSSGISGGRPAATTPMSERQQMALLMQMTSSASPSCSPDVTQQSNNHFSSKPKDRNERGETNLHVAAIKGDQESVKKLLESGVSPNVTDFAGWSPLHEACSHGHYNIAFALIKAGANVNAKGLDDDTPLHDAAVGGNLKLVKFLIEKGADIFAKNRKGKTPVDVASSNILPYMCSIRDQTRNNSDERDEAVGGDNNDDNVSHTLKNNTKDSVSSEDDKCDMRNKQDKQLSSSRVEDVYVEEESMSKSNNQSLNVQLKRPNSDAEIDETIDVDETKRKKRKDSENIKDNPKNLLSTKIPTRHEKALKQSIVPSKTSTIVKSNTEKRSPCVSPKLLQSKGNDSDLETEDGKVLDNITGGGPKVPPLKIVIPQQNSTNDIECGLRNGKTSSTRSHAALPYVVSSSNSNDSTTAEKEVNTSRCNSPMENLHKTSLVNNTNILHEEKNAKISSEEKGQQRILRSSHRSGGHNIDRSSNNSSPQLQSNCPSPTAIADASDKNINIVNNACTISPQLNVHGSENEPIGVPSPSASSTSSMREVNHSNSVELHPRKRKIRAKQEENCVKVSGTITSDVHNSTSDIHPHDYPFTNCYHMYLNIRKQIERKHRNLYPIPPRPPQGFSDYLMNRRSYLLANNNAQEFLVTVPSDLPSQMIGLYSSQEQERYKLKLRHIVEKEKLGLAVEQEILRVHGKAARSLACQSVPFSACTLLKDAEVYNLITPEQEEKDRNARSRYNGRLFLSWLQDVDDKWEKIKEAMILRHHNEAESLHAKQQMDWEEVLKDNNLCDDKSQSFMQENVVPMVHEAMILRHHNEAESLHAKQQMDWEEVLKDNNLCDDKSQSFMQENVVPMVHVSDDFDLLPA